MATIKSFTSLEQSRKLAEILPLESADMHWAKDFDGSWFVDLAEYTSVKIPKYVGNVEEHLLPCWSLASLLGILPLEIDTHKQTDGYKIYYYVESYMKRMGKEIYLSTERHENLVDACVEMIIKLYTN